MAELWSVTSNEDCTAWTQNVANTNHIDYCTELVLFLIAWCVKHAIGNLIPRYCGAEMPEKAHVMFSHAMNGLIVRDLKS